MDNSIRINDAIDFRNAKYPELAKMTQQTLGEKVFPFMDKKRSGFYLSRWNQGEKEVSKIRPHMIRIICDACEVTPNFLFGYEK